MGHDPASAGRERALLLQRWLHSNPRGRGIAAGPGVQAEGVGLRAAPGSPNRQSRTPEEKCNVARCPSPISRRSLVLKVTTCPYFVRNAAPCGDGGHNPAEFLDSSIRPAKCPGRVSSYRKRIESNSRPRPAFHVPVSEFPCFSGHLPVLATYMALRNGLRHNDTYELCLAGPSQINRDDMTIIRPPKNYGNRTPHTIRRLETWAQEHNVQVHKIAERKESREPDYRVVFSEPETTEIIVEVKEIVFPFRIISGNGEPVIQIEEIGKQGERFKSARKSAS